MEEQRQLTVVERHLAEDGGQGPEPEAQADALVADPAAGDVADVGGRGAAQVTQERQPVMSAMTGSSGSLYPSK